MKEGVVRRNNMGKMGIKKKEGIEEDIKKEWKVKGEWESGWWKYKCDRDNEYI